MTSWLPFESQDVSLVGSRSEHLPTMRFLTSHMKAASQNPYNCNKIISIEHNKRISISLIIEVITKALISEIAPKHQQKSRSNYRLHFRVLFTLVGFSLDNLLERVWIEWEWSQFDLRMMSGWKTSRCLIFYFSRLVEGKGIPAFYINREKKIRILSLSFRI